MKKTILTIVLAAVFVIPFFLFAADIPQKDVTIKKVGNKKSATTYSHVKHAKIKGAEDCKGCHEAVKTKDAAHKLCITCHKKENVGPKKCNECHK